MGLRHESLPKRTLQHGRGGCCPRIPTRDLYFCGEQASDQELSYENQRQTASTGAWLLQKTKNSKAVLLLKREAAPRDFTAVGAAGWEVLPSSQMLLGKRSQHSSAAGTRDCH